MVDLVKVRFTRPAVERVHGYVHPLNPQYTAGQEVELRKDSAERWLKRGVVEIVEDEPEPPADVRVPATEAEPAQAADSIDSGDKPVVDKRGPRKSVARDH